MSRLCHHLTSWLLAAFTAGAASPVLDNSASPHAQVRTVGLDEVRWTDGFWAQRFEFCRTQMVPGMARLMEGTNYTQFFRNFEIVAGRFEGRARGASFNDGDFYKFLEGASATLAVTNDAHLQDELDAMIAVIARAQATNGYLDTWVQLNMRNTNSSVAPFRDRNNWEIYNLGQLFTAASVHYRATGKTNFLSIARKAADYLDGVFKTPTPELALHNMCPSHYMGLVELYRATGEPRYLALAQRMMTMRDLITDGTADNQDRVPFGKQTEAEGHAVRANYLYAGAADLFLETGDTNLWKPLEAVWTNVVREKMYITGGCGALHDGAAPDGGKDQKHITRTHQAYGRDYQLPNTTAHNETCANIGNVLWNWRMFLASGEARFMDVAELALYNSVLSGVGMDGTNYSYTNPLRVTDPMPVELRWSRARVPYVSSFCCPPNLVRTLAEIGGYAYGKSSNTVWVNLYGASALATTLDGTPLKLTQATEYPWSGRLRIVVNECGSAPFALKLRIPGWTKGATVRVNNGPRSSGRESAQTSPGQGESGLTSCASGYLELHRVWKSGDVVDLDIPMPVQWLEANPLVEETLGQVAVKRGPVVYCLESTDIPAGNHVLDVCVPVGVDLLARYDQRMLGGVVTLDGTLHAKPPVDWGGELYREVKPTESKPVKVRLIPYFAWGNRGKSEMSVWLRRE